MLHSALCSSCKTWFSSFHKNWLQRCGALFSASFFFSSLLENFQYKCEMAKKIVYFSSKIRRKVGKKIIPCKQVGSTKNFKIEKEKARKEKAQSKKVWTVWPREVVLSPYNKFKLMLFKRQKSDLLQVGDFYEAEPRFPVPPVGTTSLGHTVHTLALSLCFKHPYRDILAPWTNCAIHLSF